MTDTELNVKLKHLAGEERKLTRIILEHIAEVERRGLHLRMAYSSLYEYLTREIGYSEGAAQRRIDAARAIQSIPELSKKIEEGSLKLSQITKLRKMCRDARKKHGEKVSLARQREILQKLEMKGARDTDLILAQEFELPIEKEERVRVQRDESVRVELTFTKEEMELLKQAQEIYSHASGASLKETLLAMARKAVKQNSSTATVAAKGVTPGLRRKILKRDGYRCQYVDHKTGKVCGAKAFLEIDHIEPRFAGGSNEPENLRVLCKNHNQFRYKSGL